MAADVAHKTYASRATQTDCPPLVTLSSDDDERKSPVVETPVASLASLTIVTPVLESPPAPRHLQKAHIAFNAPSSLAKARNYSRIVSLPETSPPARIKHGMTTRVVSLSEKTQIHGVEDDPQSSHELSTEISVSSDNSVRRPRCASAMPLTPSPPSSPESIMIIGNDVQLPISFINNRTAARNALVEEDGWVSWANSPPKPIPALHGPLSLPYARCPSGAEGTLVEGDDLSRVVWGLGVDKHGDSHIEGIDRNLTSKSRLEIQLPPATHHRHNQHFHKPQNPQNPSSDATTHTLPSNRPYHTSIVDRGRQQSNFGSADSDEIFDFSGGLGLQFGDSGNRIRPPGRQNTITFGRALPSSVDSGYTFSSSPHIFIDSREHPGKTSQVIIPTAPRLSALDIAQQYRLKQQLLSTLLTPPDSSATEWTRQFEDDLFSVPNSLSFDDVIHHPDALVATRSDQDGSSHLRSNSQSGADESRELRKFVFEQMKSPHNGRSPEAQERSRSHSYEPRPPVHSPKASPIRDPSALSRLHTDPRPLPSRAALPSPELTPDMAKTFVPPSPTFPEIDKATIRQPRSVPFARLMQRRLSAVPEEDSEAVSIALSSASRDRHQLCPSPMLELSNQLAERTMRPSGRSGDQRAMGIKRSDLLLRPPRQQHHQTRGTAEVGRGALNKENSGSANRKEWGRQRK